MRRLDNVVVLDGEVRRVKGLSFAGIGDPTFTPDKSLDLDEERNADYVAKAAEDLAGVAEAADGVDVVVFHDARATDVLDGTASATLSGHLHYRKVRRGSEGTWLMQRGSTGESGMRALEPEDGPARMMLSVLYLDRSSGDLLAYDDISLGGLGLASGEIDRQVVAPEETETELVAPVPDGRADRGADPGADRDTDLDSYPTAGSGDHATSGDEPTSP